MANPVTEEVTDSSAAAQTILNTNISDDIIDNPEGTGDTVSDASQTESVIPEDGEITDSESSITEDTIAAFFINSSVKLQKLAPGSTEADITLPQTITAYIRKPEMAESSIEVPSETPNETEKEPDNSIEVSVTWAFDAENSSKADLTAMELGDSYLFTGTVDTEYPIAEGVETPIITVVITNEKAFSQTVECDEVLVTVSADAGVFPDDAYIEATRDENFGDILNEAEGAEEIDGMVWTINITVYDAQGNEIQPDTTKGEVSVAFSNPAEDASAGDWDVYHYNESQNSLDKLDSKEDELTGEITAEVESFSTFMMILGASNAEYNLNSGDAKIRVTSDNQKVTIKNGDGHKNRVLIYNDTGKEATVNIYCVDVHTYTGDRGAPIYVYAQNNPTTVVLYSIPKDTPYFGTTKHKALDYDGKGSVKIMGAVDSDVPGASAHFIFECFSQYYIIKWSPSHALANNAIQVAGSPGYYLKDAYGIIGDDAYHTTDTERASQLLHKSTIWNWINLEYTNQCDVDYYYNFYPDSSATYKIDKVFRNEGKTTVSEYPDVFGYYFLGWNENADGSGKMYYPGQAYNCTRYDNKLYGISERIKNTATVNLIRDEAKWTGQTVELYEGNTCKYTLKETAAGSGKYVNKEVFNGNYDVYVNGEKSDRIFVFDSKKREGLKKSVDAKYNKYVIRTYVEDSMTPSLGEVTLRKDGMTLYHISSTTGEYTRNVLVSEGALEIFVDDKSTEHYVSSANRVENLYYYKAEVNITDDALWTDAFVILRSKDEKVEACLPYVSGSGKTAKYSDLLLKKECDEFGLYLDGIDTELSMKAAKGQAKIDITCYTPSVVIKGTDNLLNVTMDNGKVSYDLTKKDGGSSAAGIVYEAKHAIKKMVGGSEKDYQVNIENVNDDFASDRKINSANKSITYELYPVNYYVSSSTDGTEKQDLKRTAYCTKGSRIGNYKGSYGRNGYSFAYWSATTWAPGMSEDDCPQFDPKTTADKAYNLYAVFATPSVKVGDVVFTDADGIIGGSGQYYRMANLSITGFDPGEESVKYVYLTAPDVASIKMVNIPAGTTIKNGTAAAATPSGSITLTPTYDKIVITFNPAVSMLKAQDYVRNNIIFTSKQNVANTVTVEVADAAGEYEGPQTVTATLTSDALNQITNNTTGTKILENGKYYYIAPNSTVTCGSSNMGAGKSGIDVKANATAYIYIPTNSTLNVYGGNALGTTGAGAGIHIPYGSRLYVYGGGKLNAYGGKAADGANGGTGGTGTHTTKSGSDILSSGAGGAGGNGGGGAGAGIGGNGGAGGAGGAKPQTITVTISSDRKTWTPNIGSWPSSNSSTTMEKKVCGADGIDGASGQNAGNFFYHNVTVTAKGGIAGASGTSGGAAGGHLCEFIGGEMTFIFGAGGGGGAGSGGGAANDYGGGGYGGGGGASGGSGQLMWHWSGENWCKKNGHPADRISNGEGAPGYDNCPTSANGIGIRSTDHCPGGEAGHKGGKAGSKGAAMNKQYYNGTSHDFGITYDVSYSFDQESGNGSYSGGSTNYKALSGNASPITLPSYLCANPKVNFLRWQISKVGRNYGIASGQTTDFTNKNNTKAYKEGETLSIPNGTYGSLQFKAVVELIGGIRAESTTNPYTWSGSTAPVEYYTTNVTLSVDGVPTDMGRIEIGGNVVTADANNHVYTYIGTSNAPLPIKVDGEQVGTTAAFGLDKVSNTTVNFHSIRVKVTGYEPSTLTLEGSDSPILSSNGAVTYADGQGRTKVSECVYSYIAKPDTEDMDKEYKILVDGKDSGETVKYSEEKVLSYHTNDIVINTTGMKADAIKSVELRDEDGNKIFPILRSTEDNVAKYDIMRLYRNSDEPQYGVYVDDEHIPEFYLQRGLVDAPAEKVDFSEDGIVTVNLVKYKTYVHTKVNDEEANMGTVTIGGKEMLRTGIGIYEISSKADLSGMLIADGQSIREITSEDLGSDIYLDFYTVVYKYKGGEKETGSLPTDVALHYKDSKITAPTVGNLKNGGKTFAGWKVGDKVYKPGDEITVSTKVEATASWDRTKIIDSDVDFDVDNYFGIVVSAGDYTYDGKEHIPTTLVTRNSSLLSEGSDFEIKYENSNKSKRNDPNGGNINTVNAGTVTLTIEGIGDYCGSVSRTYEIARKSVSVSGLKGKNRPYDGTKLVELEYKNAYVDGVVAGDDLRFEGAITGTVSNAYAGKNKVVNIGKTMDASGNMVEATQLIGEDAGNYTLNSAQPIVVDITERELTLDMFTIAENPSDIVYTSSEVEPRLIGEDIHLVDDTNKNILSEEDYSYRYENNINAGTGRIIITANPLKVDPEVEEPDENELPNYKGSVTVEFTINKAPLTIKASDGTSEYMADVVVPTYSITSGSIKCDADKDSLNISAKTSVNKTFKPKVYSGANTVTYSPNANYSVTTVPGDYTVVKSSTPIPVTAKGYTGVYDGESHGIKVAMQLSDDTAKIYYAKTPLTESNYTTGTEDSVSANATYKDAGESQPVYYYVHSECYTDTSGYKNVSIAKKPLSVTAKNQTISYGDAISAVADKTYVYDENALEETGYAADSSAVTAYGIVQTDATSLNGKAISFTSAGYAAGDDVTKAGEGYELIPSFATDVTTTGVLKNYEITYRGGLLFVGKRQVQLSWSGNPTYDGREQGVTATINNFVSGDDVKVVYAASDPSETITHRAISAGDYTARIAGLTGAKASNYDIPESESSKEWKILKATNGWTTAPSISSWEEGNHAGIEPNAVPKFGIVEYKYYSDADCTIPTNTATSGADADGASIEGGKPTLCHEGAATKYYLKAVVNETPNYTALGDSTEFSISPNSGEPVKTVVYVTIDSINDTNSVEYGTDLNTNVSYKLTKDSKTGAVLIDSDLDELGIDVTKLSFTTDYDTAVKESRAVGSYSITPKYSAEAEKVTFVFEKGTFNVTKKTINVSWPDSAASKITYNGANREITANIANTEKAYADDEVAVGAYVNLPGEHKVNVAIATGEYKAIASELSGSDAGNYALSSDESDRTHSWEIVAAKNPTTKEELEAIFTVMPHIDHWYYGDTPSTPVGTSTLGKVTFLYQEKKEGISDWSIFNHKTTERPTEPGEYRLIAEVDNGAGGKIRSNSVEGDVCVFTIHKAEVVASVLDSESVYKEDVVLHTPDYAVIKGSLSPDELDDIKSKFELKTDAAKGKNVGTYAITIECKSGLLGAIFGDVSDKANVTSENAIHTITPADIDLGELSAPVTFDETVYDASEHKAEVANIHGVDDLKIYFSTAEQLTAENYSAKGSINVPGFVSAGDYVIYYYAVAENYKPLLGTVAAKINKSQLSVTIKDDETSYGQVPDYSSNIMDRLIVEGAFKDKAAEIINASSVEYHFGTIEADGSFTEYSDKSNVGTYTIKLNIPDSANVAFVNNNGTLTVNKKDISDTEFASLFTDNVPAGGITYRHSLEGGTVIPVVQIKDDMGAATDEFEITVMNYDKAGTATITAKAKSDCTNYKGSTAREYTINKKTVAVSLTKSEYERFYGQNDEEFVCQTEPTLTDEEREDVLEIKGITRVAKTAAPGRYEGGVTAKYNDNPNYNVIVVNSDLVVKPRALDVTDADYEGVYDGTGHTGSVTVKTGTAFSIVDVYYNNTTELTSENYQSVAGTVKNSIPKFTSAGDYKVYYLVACTGFEPVKGDFNVSIDKRPIELEWKLDGEATQSVIANGENHSANAMVKGNVAVGDNLGVTSYALEKWDDATSDYVSVSESKEVGDYRVTATVTGERASNYVVSGVTFHYIVKENPTDPKKANSFITGPSSRDVVYGDKVSPISAEAKYGTVASTYYTDAGCTQLTGTMHGATENGGMPTLPGSYYAVAQVAETSEYTGCTSGVLSFEIKKRPITVVASDITVPYGEAVTLDGKYSISGGIVDGDEVTVNLTSQALTTGTPIGIYSIEISIGGGNKDYYDIKTVNGTCTIVGAENVISVTATGYNGVYDNDNHSIKVEVKKDGSIVNDVEIFYSETALNESNYGKGSKDAIRKKNAGDYKIYYYVASDKYAPVAGSCDIKISKKEVTVKAKDQSIAYGDAKPTGGNVESNGFLGGDTLTSLAVAPTLSYDYEQFDSVGEYTIETILSTNETDNYKLIPVNGTLNVNKKNIIFRWTKSNLEYNGEEQSVTATPMGLLNGDSVKAVAIGNKAIEVGDYLATVQGLANGKSGNYTFDPEDETAKLYWTISMAGNMFTVYPSAKDYAFGDEPANPGAAAKFGTVVYTYYKDSYCMQPTDAESGSANEGDAPSLPGTYYVRASVPGCTSYEEIFSDALKFEVIKRELVIDVDNIYAEKPSEQKELKCSIRSGGLVSGYPLDINLTLPDSFDKDTVGEYEITATVKAKEGEEFNPADYYNIKINGGKYYVTDSAVSVVARGYSGVYDGEDHGIEVTVTVPAGKEGSYKVFYSTEAADADQLAAMKSAVTTEDIEHLADVGIETTSPTTRSVGETTVYYYVIYTEDSGDKTVYSGSEKIEETARNLTIKAKDAVMFAGDTIKNEGVEYDGFAEGETEASLMGSLIYVYSYQNGDPAGDYTITPSGLRSSNYAITFESGKLTVKERPDKVKVSFPGATPAVVPQTFGTIEEAIEYADEYVNNHPGTKAEVEVLKSPSVIKEDITIDENVTFIIPEGQDVTVDPGVEVTNEGEIDNKGELTNNGSIDNEPGSSFTNEGDFTNNGNFENEGNIENKPGSDMTNNGTIDNFGDFDNKGSLDNESEIDNESGGTFENESGGNVYNGGTLNNAPGGEVDNGGAFDNAGKINNDGDFNNEGGGNIKNEAGATINNLDDGTFDNDGKIDNKKGAGIVNDGKIDNSGEIKNESEGNITNNGDIDNDGNFDNESGGVIINKGDISTTAPGQTTNKGTIDNSEGTINDDEGTNGTTKNQGTIKGGEINGPVTNEPGGVIDKPSKIKDKIENEGNINLDPNTDVSEVDIEDIGEGKTTVITNPPPSGGGDDPGSGSGNGTPAAIPVPTKVPLLPTVPGIVEDILQRNGIGNRNLTNGNGEAGDDGNESASGTDKSSLIDNGQGSNEAGDSDDGKKSLEDLIDEMKAADDTKQPAEAVIAETDTKEEKQVIKKAAIEAVKESLKEVVSGETLMAASDPIDMEAVLDEYNSDWREELQRNGSVNVTMTVPDTMQFDGGQYYVVGIKDGKSVLIPATINEDGSITFSITDPDVDYSVVLLTDEKIPLAQMMGFDNYLKMRSCSAHYFAILTFILGCLYILLGKRKEKREILIALGICALANVIIIIFGNCVADIVAAAVSEALVGLSVPIKNRITKERDI